MKRGTHDALVWSLAGGFRQLGYGIGVEEHCRHVGRADLLISCGIFGRWDGTADATVEVKTRLDGRYLVEQGCRQVLRYATTWRRPDGRISIPFIVAATDRVHPDAAEWARRRGVHLLDGTNYPGTLAVITGMIGAPTREAEEARALAEYQASRARDRAAFEERLVAIRAAKAQRRTVSA